MGRSNLFGTIAACVMMAGCASDAQPPVTPTLPDYDDLVLRKVADELASAPADCGWCVMIEDYARMRAEIRAIRGVGED